MGITWLLAPAITLLGFGQNFIFCHAAVQSFQLKNVGVEIEVPERWQVARDLFGLPLQILGPQNGTFRPVLSLTDTPLSNIIFDTTKSKPNEGLYQKGRTTWLKKKGGKLISFLPYKSFQSHQMDFHEIGFEFWLKNLAYREKTYVFLCKNKLVYLKTLESRQNKLSHELVFKKIIASLKCG
jgi:hypothetical protein